jgi:hypothetical protein
MLEGKFLKGCTPKAARPYATRAFQEISDNQEGQEAKFQDGKRSLGLPELFRSPPGSVDVIITLRQIMTICREFRVREDRLA